MPSPSQSAAASDEPRRPNRALPSARHAASASAAQCEPRRKGAKAAPPSKTKTAPTCPGWGGEGGDGAQSGGGAPLLAVGQGAHLVGAARPRAQLHPAARDEGGRIHGRRDDEVLWGGRMRRGVRSGALCPCHCPAAAGSSSRQQQRQQAAAAAAHLHAVARDVGQEELPPEARVGHGAEQRRELRGRRQRRFPHSSSSGRERVEESHGTGRAAVEDGGGRSRRGPPPCLVQQQQQGGQAGGRTC